MRLLTLLLLIKLSAGQLSLGNEVELVPAMPNMAQITNLDVQCEKSGMTVNVEFSQPFDGIIFSKGHFSNPACRYLAANSGRSRYTLNIPSEGCGSAMSQFDSTNPEKKKSVSQTRMVNTIIVQNDPTIQEIWDIARTIKCDWVDNFVKSVAFSPFSVGMLDAQEVAFKGDNPIECWMDLKQGEWPNTKDVDSVVKIGETLSLMVYARDNAGMYDVSVKDCYAFGGPDFDNVNTPQIQLTDSQGCVLKDKLISSFYTSRERDAKGEVIVTYAYVKAFKFPDVMDVFMSCNIEVCKGDCDNLCGSTTTTEGPFPSGSTLFGEAITTLRPSTPPLCFPGSNDPRCPKPTSPRPTPPSQPVCGPGSNDPSCRVNFPQENRPSTTTCEFGSKNPNCATSSPNVGKALKPRPPPQQLFGSSVLPSSFTTPAPPRTTPFICRPGSLDPRCPKPTTNAPLRCFLGSTDPRCPQLTSPKPTTPSPPRCFPGSLDPRCPKPTTPAPPRCFAGSTDPRCPRPTTPAPPNCFPGSSDPRCPRPTTPSPPRCFPGSLDPRCPRLTTLAPTTPAPPRCFPGSRDPRCPKPTTLAPTTPARPLCFAGSTDPRCPRPTTLAPAPLRCFIGSKDPRCPQPTTPAPPRCFPGSTDPRCPKQTTSPPPRCFIGSTDPRCPKLTTSPPPQCFPGSTDPRCPRPTTFRPVTTPRPICFGGSRDPRCPQTTSFARPQPTRAPAPKPTVRPTPRPTSRPSPRPTTRAPPRITKAPTPKPTTPKPIREGFALFPVTQTTPRPTSRRPFTTRKPVRPKPTVPAPSLKPKQTTQQKPNRGKQLVSSVPQPKPEPTGKEWEGESRYHAFHSFHFQRGDGRRGRQFGARITRGIDFPVDMLPSVTGKRPLQEKVPIRLSRSLSVIAPETNSDVDNSLSELKAKPFAAAQTSIDPIYNDPIGTVCFPMAIFTASMLAFLFLLLLSSTAALVLYIRQRQPPKANNFWHEH